MRRPPDALRGFLAAFDPAIGKLFLAARRAVLTAAPGSNELVYDAWNAVSAAYTFSDRLAERALLRAAVAQGRSLVAAPPAKPASRVRPTTGAKRRPKRR